MTRCFCLKFVSVSLSEMITVCPLTVQTTVQHVSFQLRPWCQRENVRCVNLVCQAKKTRKDKEPCEHTLNSATASQVDLLLIGSPHWSMIETNLSVFEGSSCRPGSSSSGRHTGDQHSIECPPSSQPSPVILLSLVKWSHCCVTTEMWKVFSCSSVQRPGAEHVFV